MAGSMRAPSAARCLRRAAALGLGGPQPAGLRGALAGTAPSLPALQPRLLPTASCADVQQARGFAASGGPSPTKLDGIVDLAKFQGLEPEQCEALWQEFHSDRSRACVGAVLTSEEYKLFEQRAAESSKFVMPLMKPGGGFLTLFMQCQLPHVLYTTLEEYMRVGPDAPVHMHVTHYTELQESKGLVLVRGDVTSETDVNNHEAQTLLSLMHSYYLNPTGYLKVHTFNHSPDTFDFDEVVSVNQAAHDAMEESKGRGKGTDDPKPE